MAVGVRENAFQEVVGPLEPKEAMEEALRCYYCYDAPCIRGCPTGINIPVFIHHIATGDLDASARTILDANILGATCARICPTEALCEGNCVRVQDSRPVSIGRLQRVAMDHAMARGIPDLPAMPVSGAGRVAVVGAGPAGMGAASILRRMGYEVDVYESRPQGGGLDTYGIVSYREPLLVSLWEVGVVQEMGARFHFETTVGRDVSWAALRQEYDAVIIAAGLGKVPRLGILGEELAGVWDALELVELTKTVRLDDIVVGNRVAVIGAGNTAVDAATCAKRLGAEEVTILYRRGEHAMSAYRYEYEFAKKEGIAYKWQTIPVEILGSQHVEGVRCMRTRVVTGQETDRAVAVETVPGSEFVLPVDTVIRAIGQEKRTDIWQEIGVKVERGRVVVNPETYETSLTRVYAIGDCLARSGEATVVNAVEEGKKAAWAIHQQLMHQKTRKP